MQASDFRKGTTFDMDGQAYVVVDFQHVKPGKGAAFVRVKYKNIVTGAIREEAFNPDDKYDSAYIERRNMLYSYKEDNLYYFMDQESYEMEPISEDLIGDSMNFVLENMECKVMSYNGKVFGIEPPNFVELKVVSTEPGVKGNTATNVTKPATVETGAEVKVPIFIEEGETIQIDTRTGEYMCRA